MASGHVNRIERPNTWLHRPMLQNVKKHLPTRSRPHMARNGPGAISALSPVSGLKQKFDFGGVSQFLTERTSDEMSRAPAVRDSRSSQFVARTA
jgi:hypothetical protein